MEITEEQIRAEAKACDFRKVEQARRMGSRERFFAGAELFDQACEWSLAGLRETHPKWSEEDLRSELKRLLKMAEKLGV